MIELSFMFKTTVYFLGDFINNTLIFYFLWIKAQKKFLWYLFVFKQMLQTFMFKQSVFMLK